MPMPSPTRSCRVRRANSATKASWICSTTKKRSDEVHTCPAIRKAELTQPAAATSSGAWREMIIGSLPPASSTQGFMRSAQATPTARAAATLPVKATACVPGDWISSCAVLASPGRQATRPGGKAEKYAMKRKVHSAVASAGLMMQALPAASEAATVQHSSRIG
jgi:hypothetical protein